MEISDTSYTFSRPKAIFVANSDWYLYNFRVNLIRQAEDAGWQITLICTQGPYVPRLKEQGWRVIVLPLESAGANPLRETKAFAQLAHTLRAERPHVVHLFTLKCVLYGCLAAPLVPNAYFIGALTGMGYLFTSATRKTRALKQLVLAGLRLGLKQSKAQLIFQNEFDRQEFVNARLVSANRTRVIRGSGVDCQAFCPSERSRDPDTPPRLLFCGRLLAEKGIHEYLEATRQLRSRGHRFSSHIAGAPYPGNPSSLTPSEVDALAAEDSHKYLGHHADMKDLLAESDIVVLPTYREGTPKVLLEAAACGCLIVTTDIPGCQGIVDPGENGDLVPVRDVEALVQSIERIFALSENEIAAMKTRSREIAVERFSETRVNAETLALYAKVHRSG
jgi:glycosyltransferase involved in cell wall biosynthesis